VDQGTQVVHRIVGGCPLGADTVQIGPDGGDGDTEPAGGSSLIRVISSSADHQYYRLLTAAFLHVNLLHIAVNMYSLCLLGPPLEALLGRVRYLALFVVGAVGGTTLSYLVNGPGAASVGASTALFAFLAASFVIVRRLRGNTRAILSTVGFNLVLTFSVPWIDKWGHLGGLAVGVLVGLVFAHVPARRAWLQAAAVAGVLALLVVAAVVKTATISPTA
jgi:membrane associated rhomboid family serine protease